MIFMIPKSVRLPWLLAALIACDGGQDPGRVPSQISSVCGDGQSVSPGSPLAQPLSVRVSSAAGDPVADVTVSWSVLAGDGTVSPTSSSTNPDGVASAGFTLGPTEGEHQARAEVIGLAGSPVVFTAQATATPVLGVVGCGNNVPERFSSDLWVHGAFAYTGTWGFRNEVGNVLQVWALGASGAPTPIGSVAVAGIGTVSDVQVSDDGQLLVLSGERGDNGGIYLYGLSDPARPSFLGSATVGSAGVHTVTLSTINARTYAFAARNPGFSDEPEDEPALLIYDVTEPATPVLVHREPIPANYGIHDTFVRDGIAFVFAWNTGVVIYDVGNGIRAGTPEAPVEISRLVTASNGVSGGPAVHNGWWFHNSVTGEQRYLFIGQEGPGVIGSQSSGDIHVVDVSDLTNPREVAFFHLDGAGTHNFWMDEARQILYAAYYNGGVVALDVSGTLAGDLSSRLLRRVRPGGTGNTYAWGVQLANGSLYAIDMVSGLWQLRAE
jgi:hypothetical protein